jgi:hypothetical protein
MTQKTMDMDRIKYGISSYCEAHTRLLFESHENLSHHMIRQARTGVTGLVKRREMKGRTQTLPWWLEEKGKRRQKTKYIDTVAVTGFSRIRD